MRPLINDDIIFSLTSGWYGLLYLRCYSSTTPLDVSLLRRKAIFTFFYTKAALLANFSKEQRKSPSLKKSDFTLRLTPNES